MTMSSKTPHHAVSYARFVWESARIAFAGGPMFYAWMTALTAVALVGVNAFAHQTVRGMILTNMTDHVSWGLYIANFTFLVGLAAGAVMMVIPAYLYRDRQMHHVVIYGELLAIAAIMMCLCFVTADLGRPDRFWHMLIGVGRFNWPISMLSWDVLVLSGYLLINLHVTGYLVYHRFIGQKPRARWYLPFVFLSIVWAVSIHSVTAFLYSGLGGRPFWNTAILAPRFIMSAFVTGPAFLILTLKVIDRLSSMRVPEGPIHTLRAVLKVTVLGNLFMVGAEAFTQFYTGGHHATAAEYLYFGTHGHHALVPWIWSAMGLNTLAAGLLLWGDHSRRPELSLVVACIAVFCGVWIEKGMGLIVPGFVPSTLHELVEYLPSATEWKVAAGIWAFGLGLYTVAVKVTAQMLTGESRLDPHPEAVADGLPPPEPA